jgi:hypothetical protein
VIDAAEALFRVIDAATRNAPSRVSSNIRPSKSSWIRRADSESIATATVVGYCTPTS